MKKTVRRRLGREWKMDGSTVGPFSTRDGHDTGDRGRRMDFIHVVGRV